MPVRKKNRKRRVFRKKKSVVRLVEAIVKDSKGRVLILKRSRNNTIYVGKWQLPGGKVERGESPLRAVKREVNEELGCNCSILKAERKLVFSSFFRKKRSVVELTIFSCKILGKVCLSRDHSTFKFVKPDSLQRHLLAPITKKALSS